MADVVHMYRVDIGFDPGKGYSAVLGDIPAQRMKGIRGNSIEQLMSRLRHVIIEEEGKRRAFPLEHEEPSRIITNGF